MTVRMVHRKVALSVFTLFLVHGSTRSTKVFPPFVEGQDCKVVSNTGTFENYTRRCSVSFTLANDQPDGDTCKDFV